MAGCSTKHTLLKELGQKKLSLINKKTIFVAGAGGLGSILLEYLSRFNPKRIIIVDHDKVDSSNLERQILYTKSSLGKNKVDIAKNRLSDFTQVTAYNKNIEQIQNDKKMHKDFIESDLVIDCIDDICSKEFLFNYAKENKKTLIVGSCVSTKGYVYTANFKNKKYEQFYKKKYLDDKQSGVYSITVGICGLIMSTNAVKLMLGIKKDMNKFYNINGWEVYIESYKV